MHFNNFQFVLAIGILLAAIIGMFFGVSAQRNGTITGTNAEKHGKQLQRKNFASANFQSSTPVGSFGFPPRATMVSKGKISLARSALDITG